MTIHFPFLILALVLLWFPRTWMRRVPALFKRRRRSKGSERIMEPWKDREPGDPKVNAKVELTKLRNYIDLARALAGGILLWGGLGWGAALGVAEGSAGSASLQVFGAQCVISTIAVIVQAVRYEKVRLSFFPPIFFLAGLSVAVCGYKVAVFSFVMVWAINSGLGNAQAFLTVYAGALMAFGAVFLSFTSLRVILASGLTFLPVLLSLMAKRPLMIFTRKGSRG